MPTAGPFRVSVYVLCTNDAPGASPDPARSAAGTPRRRYGGRDAPDLSWDRRLATPPADRGHGDAGLAIVATTVRERNPEATSCGTRAPAGGLVWPARACAPSRRS